MHVAAALQRAGGGGGHVLHPLAQVRLQLPLLLAEALAGLARQEDGAGVDQAAQVAGQLVRLELTPASVHSTASGIFDGRKVGSASAGGSGGPAEASTVLRSSLKVATDEGDTLRTKSCA